MSVECARCSEQAELDTQKCPRCGYRPQKTMQVVGAIAMIIGLVISATIIGAIVGIPLVGFGVYRLFKGKDITIESEYGA